MSQRDITKFDVRAFLCDIAVMKRERLLSEIRRWCRKNDVALRIDTVGGKGSHIRVYVGTDRVTTLKSGDFSTTYVRLVLKQLGIPSGSIRR